jgi:RNA polymerase sigma-54 factor
MALKQSLQQRLLQKLSPQQIQLMKMLQLPTVELEKRIKEELEINPALDEGEEQANETNADLEENTENKRNEFNFDDYTNDETPYYKTHE